MNRMPAGWFGRETFPLLAAYCRHITEGERISGMLAALDEALEHEVTDKGRSEIEVICESAATRQRLLTMRDKEVRAASSLATRMRLTQQSAYDKTKAIDRRPTGPMPWESTFLDRPKAEEESDLIGGEAVRRP